MSCNVAERPGHVTASFAYHFCKLILSHLGMFSWEQRYVCSVNVRVCVLLMFMLFGPKIFSHIFAVIFSSIKKILYLSKSIKRSTVYVLVMCWLGAKCSMCVCYVCFSE